jgi:hypothetical protein
MHELSDILLYFNCTLLLLAVDGVALPPSLLLGWVLLILVAIFVEALDADAELVAFEASLEAETVLFLAL